jgi:hypothetical protein
VLANALYRQSRPLCRTPWRLSAPTWPVDESFAALNHAAELARLSGVSGLVPSVDWLLDRAVPKAALLTSQIEATLTDLFDNGAGFVVSYTGDVEEVANYLGAFRLVQDNLRDPAGLPISVRLRCDALRPLLNGARGTGKQPGELRRSQNWIGGARRKAGPERGRGAFPRCAGQ